MKPKLLPFVLLLGFFTSLAEHARAQANDNCTDAITIVTDSACVTGTSKRVGQNLTGATQQGFAYTSSCSFIANAQDVWYKFVAKTKRPTITISNIGSGWGGIGNVAIQILSGSCGSFAEEACGNGPSILPSLEKPLIP